jgi:phage terminase large subunit
MSNKAWTPGGPSPNPRGRPKGNYGRVMATVLREALNDPQYPGDPKEIIAKRAVQGLMLGYIEFPTRGGRTRKVNLGVREWNELYKFVNSHLDGPAKAEIEITHGASDDKLFVIPADAIAPSFLDVYRDINNHNHTEYVLSGGRGSTKSSFVSLAFIYLLINNPAVHGLALRQVKDTIRDSVYAQLQWAIGELGLSDQFKSTISPFEMEYLPTGQKIYFRGANDPGTIKSIKPPFGYIGLLWFEELDQFHGPEAVRKIEQSVIRGGDDAWIFKSFNPPPTRSNWANKYLAIPKATQFQHKSNYLTVPVEWLGRTFIEEAEHLKEVNPNAYEHEYMGNPVNDGGLVFPNVVLHAITDEQIAQFDRVLNGLDWGYAINPASYGKMHYDATRRILYIFAEAQYLRKSNEALFNRLVEDGLIRKEEYLEDDNPKKPVVSYPDLIIADSAEPKSVGDFKSFGANIRGAEKGPESVRYSMKWLQGLTSIIIDPVRAPVHAQQFSNYEYERTKDGEIIDEYPDKDNDAIDDTRYATNLIWRRRGE